jgi:hypothetical protein
MALDRLVEHPRVARRFHVQFIFLPQLPSKKPQLPHRPLPQIRPAIFQLRAYGELRPMQVHSQLTLRRFAPRVVEQTRSTTITTLP